MRARIMCSSIFSTTAKGSEEMGGTDRNNRLASRKGCERVARGKRSAAPGNVRLKRISASRRDAGDNISVSREISRPFSAQSFHIRVLQSCRRLSSLRQRFAILVFNERESLLCRRLESL